MKFMSFEEWMKDNPDLEEYEYIDCPECRGVGEFEEEDEYGNVATFFCDFCDGEGQIDKFYLEYKEQLMKDKIKYERYIKLLNN